MAGILSWSQYVKDVYYIDGLVQERRNSSVLLELRLYCTDPLICCYILHNFSSLKWHMKTTSLLMEDKVPFILQSPFTSSDYLVIQGDVDMVLALLCLVDIW